MKENEKRIRVDFDHSRGSLTLRKIGTILPEDTFSLVFKKATVVQKQSRMERDTFRGGARVWVGEREKCSINWWLLHADKPVMRDDAKDLTSSQRRRYRI